MPTYTVASLQGGSGKTTVASELAATLAQEGHRVLVIDLCASGDLTTRMGLTPATEVTSVAADALTGGDHPLVPEPAPGVPGAWVLAGTYDLAAMRQCPDLVAEFATRLPGVAGQFDDVVIDTPPVLGPVKLAGLAAADLIVAASSCSTEGYDALVTLEQVLDHRLSSTGIRRGSRIDIIVPVRHDGRRLLDQEVLEAMAAAWPGRVTHPIREAVDVRDAYTSGQPLSRYAPTSPVAGDVTIATRQVLRLCRCTPCTRRYAPAGTPPLTSAPR